MRSWLFVFLLRTVHLDLGVGRFEVSLSIPVWGKENACSGWIDLFSLGLTGSTGEAGPPSARQQAVLGL